LSAAQTHAAPDHFGTCPAAHAVVGSRFVAARFTVPVVVIGPPASPGPVPTLVTVPPAIWSRHAAALRMIEPDCGVVLPTSRFAPHAVSIPALACSNPVPLRVIVDSRTNTLAVLPDADTPAPALSLTTVWVSTTALVALAPGAAATPAPFFVTLERSTVSRAPAPAALGTTATPVVALLLNSLSRTSTVVVPAPGATRRPSAFVRAVTPDRRTVDPPSTSTPAAVMFEITMPSMCTSPACTRTPLAPPNPLTVSPRSTTFVAGAATVIPSPALTDTPAYTPAGDWIVTFLFTVTAP